MRALRGVGARPGHAGRGIHDEAGAVLCGSGGGGAVRGGGSSGCELFGQASRELRRAGHLDGGTVRLVHRRSPSGAAAEMPVSRATASESWVSIAAWLRASWAT